MLPFTREVFLSVFAQYNAAIWPAQAAAYVLGAAALALAVRPRPGAGRIVAAVLAAFWLWTGIAYHLMHFAGVNFAAPAFAAGFVVQGALLAWTGAWRGRLAFRVAADPAGWAGLGLAVFAMLAYPLLGWLAGRAWPEAAAFGVAPCPTTLFTLGVLLLARDRVPWHLLVLPLAWAVVGGSSAWLLEIPEDASLPAAGVLAAGLAVWKNRRAAARPGG